MVQPESSRGLGYPSSWFILFVPLSVIPWLAGVESVRRAHNALSRRSAWRNGVAACMLVILALMCGTLPLLVAYWPFTN